MNVKTEVLSGLTVALALIPEAVAFAFVAGVEPLVGLYAAFLVGLMTSFFGGRPGMISGATGALAVVMVELVASHGVEYLFGAVVLMGVFQLLAGFFKLGKYARLIPHPVMLGFVNGLAIVIFLSQLVQFKFLQNGELAWLSGNALYIMLGLVALTMAIIHFFPKISKSIPAALVAILSVTVIVNLFNIGTKSVKDLASIAGGFPSFHIPQIPFTLETLYIILPYGLILAAIGLIESLLTLNLIDEITHTRGKSNQECVGQGVANVVTGFFGGMGGCAMIGQSMININSGGRTRLSSLSAALFLLVCILFAAPLIEFIPVAALVGVMFMVVISTFEWSSFRVLRNIPRSDAFVLILVSVVTVLTDLAIAVMVGIIVSALVFAWERGKVIEVKTVTKKSEKIYKLSGPLFFGSVKNFMDLFDIENDPKNVYIDFRHSRVHDHSAIDAIDRLTEKYAKLKKDLHIQNVSHECRTLLTKAKDITEINLVEDDWKHIASNKLD